MAEHFLNQISSGNAGITAEINEVPLLSFFFISPPTVSAYCYPSDLSFLEMQPAQENVKFNKMSSTARVES